MPLRRANCPICDNVFAGTPQRNFLGFWRVICPECTSPILTPLSTSYRVLYAIFSLLLGAVFVSTLVGEDGDPMDALRMFAFTGLVVGVLVHDLRLRRAAPTD